MSTLALSLLPANPSFAGHQTFAVRPGWLKKGLDAIQNPDTGGPTLFTRDDALVTLGVGKNMVQSIRHWLLTFRLAEESTASRGRQILPTDVGKRLFGTPDTDPTSEVPAQCDGWDSFLEDEATLWLLHWQLSGSGSVAFTWVWAFNRFREYEFTRLELMDSVQEGVNALINKEVSKETIGRDVDCLLHCYVPSTRSTLTDDNLDCPLQGLGLLRAAYGDRYRFQIGPKPSLPAHLFVYSLICFWRERHLNARKLAFYEIAYGEGSPGKVFRLDEDSLLPYLDVVDTITGERIGFEDDALTRYVVWRSDLDFDPLTLLEAYYRG